MPWFAPALGRRLLAERLFHPRSVAVIGTDTAAGARVLGNLAGGGFAGAILPVPAADAAGSIAAWPDIAALPAPPDLAVIATAPEQTAPTLAELGGRGCPAAVVVTAPAPGLAEAARQCGVRVLGPGAFGIAIPALSLNATLSHLPVPPGRAALVSQSAALCRAVLDWAEPNGLGFSHIVGLGGKVDIGFALVLDWLSRDPGTGAILLDIRAIADRMAFLSAARAAARLRPVVAIRAGGRMADPTGEADAVFEAALRRAGVLAVTSLEHLLAAAETLTRARPARGEALAIVTNAVGPGRMAADAALRSRIALADLPAATRARLELGVPEAARGHALPTEPLYVGVDNPIRLAEAAAVLAAVPEVGGVLVILAPNGEGDAAGIEALAACSATAKAPVLAAVMGETTGAAHRRRLAEAGMAVFAGPEQAVRGFLHLAQNRRNRAAARELPPRTVLKQAPDREGVRHRFAEIRRAGRLTLAQDEALAALAAYDVPIVPTRRALGGDAAAAAAAEIGFPAVLKLRRIECPGERAPAGALMLGLSDESAVRRAALALAGLDPAAAERGFLVQRQVGRARELMIRVADDATFGPAIRFGQGGTAAAVLADFAVDLPPLNLPLAHALLARPLVARTLGEFRDFPAVSTDAIAGALVRVSQLIIDFPEIAELEINPLFAGADGVAVANAWMRLRAAGEAAELAIAPYPAELSEIWQAGGERLIIRPIRPEDAEAHIAFFHRLPPEDVRFRFFTPLRELSHEQMARMTEIDYRREMAFIAVREASGETVGVARLAREPDAAAAEFAVIVEPDVKGRGLATHLVRRLIDWARGEGIAEITGQVLADNAPMLAFVRRLGFDVHRDAGDEGLLEARMKLQ